MGCSRRKKGAEIRPKRCSQVMIGLILCSATELSFNMIGFMVRVLAYISISTKDLGVTHAGRGKE